jgi:hypothetical protein
VQVIDSGEKPDLERECDDSHRAAQAVLDQEKAHRQDEEGEGGHVGPVAAPEDAHASTESVRE